MERLGGRTERTYGLNDPMITRIEQGYFVNEPTEQGAQPYFTNEPLGSRTEQAFFSNDALGQRIEQHNLTNTSMGQRTDHCQCNDLNERSGKKFEYYCVDEIGEGRDARGARSHGVGAKVKEAFHDMKDKLSEAGEKVKEKMTGN